MVRLAPQPLLAMMARLALLVEQRPRHPDPGKVTAEKQFGQGVVNKHCTGSMQVTARPLALAPRSMSASPALTENCRSLTAAANCPAQRCSIRDRPRTNVISELTRQTPAPYVMPWLDGLTAAEVVTTAVTAAELLYGVARMPDGRRKTELAAAVHGLPSDAQYVPR